MEQRKEILLLLWGKVGRMKEYIVETNGFTKNGRFIVADRVKIIKKGELIRCKDCKHFVQDVWGVADGIPLIVGHEMCDFWGDGCKTNENGWCFCAERKDNV